MVGQLSQSVGTDEKPGVARLTRLDGLRGIAACVVAIYHVQILYTGGLGDFYGGAVGWIYRWGWTFVDLFFVISGYIFAHVYAAAAGLNGRGWLGDFGIARIARLYPLHLAMLLIVLVLDWGAPENNVRNFLAHLFMLQGLIPGAAKGFVGPSWSISVEMVCYVLFALAASAGSKILLRVSIAAAALSVVMLGVTGLPGGPWNSDDILRGMLGFFVGQLLWRYRDPLRRLPTVLLVAAFAVGAMIDVGSLSPLLPLGLLAWPSALLLALRVRWFESAPLVWLGDRSYAIYLVHYPVLTFFIKALKPLQPDTIGLIGIYLVYGAIVLSLSDLALRMIERPGRKAVRQAWRKRRSGLVAGAPALPAKTE
jgi:peptidoglycan/LPS O-acetylase OafA/YrhL